MALCKNYDSLWLLGFCKTRMRHMHIFINSKPKPNIGIPCELFLQLNNIHYTLEVWDTTIPIIINLKVTTIS